MPYIVECAVLPTFDAGGFISCTDPVVREAPVRVADLSQQDLSELTALVLGLFVTAFLWNRLIKFVWHTQVSKNN